MRSALLLVALVLFPTLPVAEAAPLPPCVSPNTLVHQSNAAYVYPEYSRNRVSVWQETNGLRGLQAFACEKDGQAYEADTRITEVPVPFCVGSVCIL